MDCKPWLKEYLYLGAHLANGSNWEEEGDGNFTNGAICERHNAKIGCRFELIATYSINIGDKIILHYNLSINHYLNIYYSVSLHS